MWQSDPTDWTISSVKSGHLRSVICGQPTSVLTVFLVGADLIPQARRLRVRFAVPPEERAEFLERLRTLSEGLPIAAQLDWDLSEADDVDPASTRAPNATGPTVSPMLQRTGASP